MTAGRSLASYGDLIAAAGGRWPGTRHATALLRGAVPAARDARLDGHLRLLKAHLDRIAETLAALPDPATTALAQPVAAASELVVVDHTPDPSLPAVALDATLDRLAQWLLGRLTSWPELARDLAVATARLVEDGQVLQPEARRQRPLGRGFESLLDERLRRRFALLPDRAGWLAALDRQLPLLMEEPEEGLRQFQREVGTNLSADDLTWLDRERRVAMLHRVRRNKTEDGRIRWFLRRDDTHGVVLDRFGVRGHWIVNGTGRPTDLARLGTAVERIRSPRPSTPTPAAGWRVITTLADELDPTGQLPIPVVSLDVLPAALVTVADPMTLRAEVRRHLGTAAAGVPRIGDALTPRPPDPVDRQERRSYAIRADADGVALVAQDPSSGGVTIVAHVDHLADDDDVMSFLDATACVADLAVPTDGIDDAYRDSAPVQWVRALLRTRARIRTAAKPRGIRLVYVPSAIQHQLGGVPLIGLEFLRDRLERAGDRVHVLHLPPADFTRRLPELLGADVVGIGVYIHNGEEVARLVQLLRGAGFTGKIVLGGPQLRDIDQIQSGIDGWDALIRGEAEDVLPRVLQILAQLDAGRWADALAEASTLAGVAIRYARAVLLCDTASHNRASTIACPLPFDWRRGKSRRHLQMNFSRGCPYLCTFCPNHQGQRFRAGPVDELWRYTILAVADDLPLPAETERRIARSIQDHLGVGSPVRPRLALSLLQAGCDARQLRAWLAPLREFAAAQATSDPVALHDLIGCSDTIDGQLRSIGTEPLTAWQVKQTWLLAKIAVLASRQLWRQTGEREDRLALLSTPGRDPFVLATSEDNTLVNRSTMREYLARRIRYGLADDVVFNPGQNTIWDLTDIRGGADEEYIDVLVDHNPFAVALGADGASNPVIRQNRKPRYRVHEVLAVNRALLRRGVEVANNYILITPETDLLEAVEAFTLFVLLPVPWRDYGDSINLRVIKEDATLAHDEGLLFAPEDTGWYEPLRFPEVDALLRRWSLSPEVRARDIRPLLWHILEADDQVRSLLPDVVRRWALDYDGDPELASLGRCISARRRPDVPLVQTLREVRDELAATFANGAGPQARPQSRRSATSAG